jgi:hypothetical protein
MSAISGAVSADRLLRYFKTIIITHFTFFSKIVLAAENSKKLFTSNLLNDVVLKQLWLFIKN